MFNVFTFGFDTSIKTISPLIVPFLALDHSPDDYSTGDYQADIKRAVKSPDIFSPGIIHWETNQWANKTNNHVTVKQ